MDYREILDVIVYPTRIGAGAKGIPASMWDTASVFNKDGKRIPNSSAFYHDCYGPLNGETVESFFQGNLQEIEEIEKRPSIYMGVITLQHGHFLMNTLSSFWFLFKYKDILSLTSMKLVFTIFTEWDVNNWDTAKSKSFENLTLALNSIGFSENNIKIVNKVTIFEKLLIPEIFKYKRFHKINNSFFDTFSQYVVSIPSEVTVSPRIWLTRNGINTRGVTNEHEIEQLLFNKFNFVKVYLDYSMKLSDQIKIINSADICAGISGSNTHNVIFMKPTGVSIIIGNNRERQAASHPEQVSAAEMMNVKQFFIDYKESPEDKFDIDYLFAEFNKIMVEFWDDL